MTAPKPLTEKSLKKLLNAFRYDDVAPRYETIRVMATLDQQTRRVNAVRALHTQGGEGGCDACDWTWPCPTIKALDS